MTGHRDEPATREPRRSKRLQRSMPEAAPPPRRRIRRAEGPAPRREDEASVPAARVARSRSPPNRERDSEGASVAPPPQACPAEAPVPPQRKDSTAWPRTAYRLRNRRVPDTGNRKPIPPPCYEKREQLKQDRPRFSKEQLEQDEFWQAPACARKGLERYNNMNQEDEHELVKAVDVNPFVFCGMWLHANFLARRKGANNCVDLVPKYFFAELKIDPNGLSCVSCIKIDSVDSKNLGGCGVCPKTFMHPVVGGYIGVQPRRNQPAAGGLQISFSF